VVQGSLLTLDGTPPTQLTNARGASAFVLKKDAVTFALREIEFVLAFPSRGIRPDIRKRVAPRRKAKGEIFLFESAVTH
jgi:hypothetical protein